MASRRGGNAPLPWGTALGGWNCLLLKHFREMTPLDPFLGWKGLIYTQLSES